MHHENQTRTVLESVHSATFPVYGLSGHPRGFAIVKHGLGISHFASLASVSFVFTNSHFSDSTDAPHFKKSENFQITSADATMQSPDGKQIIFDLEDTSEDQLFNGKRGLFRDYHFSKEEQKQADGPFIWEGILSLGDAAFSCKVLHWRSPLQVSRFLLKSEETILIGNAYGPSYNDLIQLLKDLQIINHQDNLLRQYQYEFENPNV
jgi:hypothetical protein